MEKNYLKTIRQLTLFTLMLFWCISSFGVNNLEVYGVESPIGANGIYTYNGLTGNGYDSWIRQDGATTYYIYCGNYWGPYAWNIDNNETESDDSYFYCDGTSSGAPSSPVGLVFSAGALGVFIDGQTSAGRTIVAEAPSASAPTVSTSAVSSIASTTATGNGNVTATGGADVTERGVYYSTTNGFSDGTGTKVSTTGTWSSTGTYTQAITGLTANTTYYVKAFATNSAGTGYGSQVSFTTTAVAPTATTNAATSVTSTTVTLNGSVNANNASTAVTFEYGLTTSYGSSVTAAGSPVTGTSSTGVTYALTGLTPNTTYHYRVVGVNSAGTTNGSDQSFTTSAVVPTATTNAATSVTSTTVTLNGSVNANNASTSVTFEYGLTTSYGSSVTAAGSPVTGTSSTGVTYALTGLTPNTTYHYRVVGVNSAGTTNGSDQSFTTTAVAPTATTNAATSVTSTTVTLNGSVNANNASTSVTFEYGLTTSYGSSVTAAGSPVTGTSSTGVTYALTGLTPNTTYHYRVVGVNSAGTTNGSDESFTTDVAAASTFTGPGDWSDAGNWSAGIPGSSTDVTISSGTITVNSDVTCADLTISSGAVVSISSGNTLTVSGTLTNSVGTSGLVVASGGGLITSSSVSGTAELYLIQEQWHYMGIPVDGVSNVNDVLADCYVTTISAANASHNSDAGWEYLNPGDAMQKMKGYAVRYGWTAYESVKVGNITKSFSGTLNTGENTVNTSGSNQGWNFIANPYPCTVNWDNLKVSGLTNVLDAIYVWDSGTYASYVGGESTGSQNQYIAPMQGFFVSSPSDGSVTFNNTDKSSTSATFKDQLIQSIVRLSLIDGENLNDDFILRIKQGTTDQFDGNWDAYKLKAETSLVPQLYSVYNGDEYSINSIPEITEDLIIPIEMMIKSTGEHQLVLKELEDYMETYPINLFSMSGELLANLDVEDYVFTAKEGDVLNFYLGFASSLVGVDHVIKNNIFLNTTESTLWIKRMDNIPSEVSIITVTGQEVFRKEVCTHELNVNLPGDGVYIVKVRQNNGSVFNGKAVINF